MTGSEPPKKLRGAPRPLNFFVHWKNVERAAHERLFDALIECNASKEAAEKAIGVIATSIAFFDSDREAEIVRVASLMHDLNDALERLSRKQRADLDRRLTHRGLFASSMPPSSILDPLAASLETACARLPRPTLKRTGRKSLSKDLSWLVQDAAACWFEATGSWPSRNNLSNDDHPLHVFLSQNASPLGRKMWGDWVRKAKQSYGRGGGLLASPPE
jgi:hypothetical protein